jgi:ABC-type polysaccharide/polyol phosphate transport system ATPase subunit
LILDEVLSVGDEYFKEKSFDKMQQFFASGKTIIFVSHSAPQVSKLCSRAVLLDRGEILDEGDTEKVSYNYKKLWSTRGAEKKLFREILLREMNARSGT